MLYIKTIKGEVKMKKNRVLFLFLALLVAALLCVCANAETASADMEVVSYQVTAGEDGLFSLRVIAGLNSLEYKNYGYEITVNEGGTQKTLSGVDNKVYASVYGGDTAYSIKEYCGYEYAALATVTGLAVDSTDTVIEIRVFVTTKDGEISYGKDMTLIYEGRLDENGYPDFSVEKEEPEFLYSGTCGANLTWGLTEDGELVIRGTGAMADYTSSSKVPWYSYLSLINTVTIRTGATSIGYMAFRDCLSLTSVTIPDSVTSIGGLAFGS